MVPYNLLNKKASYLDTGTWSSKAIKEAKLFGEVEVVASSKDKNYTYIPKDYTIADDADYFHITTNNTIYGTETRKDPDVKQRLVADMSSVFSPVRSMYPNMTLSMPGHRRIWLLPV